MQNKDQLVSYFKMLKPIPVDRWFQHQTWLKPAQKVRYVM